MTVLKRIDHLGIAVHSLEDALPTWTEGLGLRHIRTEVVEEQKVRVAVLTDDQQHVELLEPTGDDSPIAKFLTKRGPGIHHTCFEVDDIESALADLKSKGFRLIDEIPRIGAGGCRIAFIHPKSCDGSLIEIKEKS